MKSLNGLLGFAAACAACCAVPLALPLFLGASGFGAALTGSQAGFMLAGILGASALWIYLRRRRRRAGCSSSPERAP